MDDHKARILLDRERQRITAELAGLGLAPIDELRRQLAAVERAEERLKAGRYGLSVESGERIPDGRLEVLPTAERTLAEEEAFEQGQ